MPKNSPFNESPCFEPEETGGEVLSHRLTNQQDFQEEVITFPHTDAITQHSTAPTTNRVQPHSPACSNLSPAEIPNLPKTKRLKYFLRNWRKLANDPLILEIVQGYTIHLISQPKQAKSSRPIAMSKEETRLVDQEIQEMLRKGAIAITGNIENQFLSLLFLVRKKDRGDRPVINLKQPNKSIQNGRDFSVERIADVWRFNVQNRSKRCLFCSFIGKRLSKVCKIPVERQSIQISLPLFRHLFSAKSIYKTHENGNPSVEKTLHKNYNLLRQYAFNGDLKGRTFDSLRYTNIPTAESGISYQC